MRKNLTLRLIVLALAALPALSLAEGFKIFHESDTPIGLPQESYVSVYPTFASVLAGSAFANNPVNYGMGGEFSVAGMAYLDGTYYLLYESDGDRGLGFELNVATFSSYDNLISGQASSMSWLQEDISPIASVKGFTYANGAFVLMTETDADATGGQEVTVSQYGNLNALIAGSQFTSNNSNLNIDPQFSIAGLAFAEGDYLMLLERDVDTGLGSEQAISTFDTFDDLVLGSPSSISWMNTNVPPTHTARGFEYEPIPEPSLMLALAAGAAALVRRRCRN